MNVIANDMKYGQDRKELFPYSKNPNLSEKKIVSYRIYKQTVNISIATP